jgi:CelD/BcsL family acetyltransferase involved in cellulose biosynthesis
VRHVSWVTSPEGFAALAGDWNALAGGGDPFCDWDWYDAYIRAYVDPRRLAICCLHDDAQLVGVYPLLASGSALVALANPETPAYRPLARDPAALAELSAAVRDGASRLELRGLPAHEPAHAILHEAVRAKGGLDVAVPQYRSPIADTTGDFGAYRAERRARWKETERRTRRAAREREARFSLLQDPGESMALLEAGLALEATGWKGRAGTAMLSSRESAGFYRDLARSAARRGELRFSALWFAGTLVAFDYSFVRHGRYLLLKTAFDESERSLSPGLVLRRAVIEACFAADELEAHEFLGPDMAWKRLFSTGAREHVGYRAYRATPGNRLRHLYRARLRRRARRLLARARPAVTRAAAHHPRRPAARRRADLGT